MKFDMTLSTVTPLNMTIGGTTTGGTRNYEKLNNKPSINDVELIGNKTLTELGLASEETDPTVPDWAKEENKPTYTADEVGAVDADNEISLEQIDAWFNAVFDS